MARGDRAPRTLGGDDIPGSVMRIRGELLDVGMMRGCVDPGNEQLGRLKDVLLMLHQPKGYPLHQQNVRGCRGVSSCRVVVD